MKFSLITLAFIFSSFYSLSNCNPINNKEDSDAIFQSIQTKINKLYEAQSKLEEILEEKGYEDPQKETAEIMKRAFDQAAPILKAEKQKGLSKN